MNKLPETIAVTVFGYWFDTSIPKDKNEYEEIVKKMEGVEKWQYTKIPSISTRFKFHKDGSIVDIETKCLFANQWNTACGKRIFQWMEYTWPNDKIKEGYYFVMTDEFKQLLKDKFKCGYCGHQYYKPKQDWCDHCLGSEYLEKSNLGLLRLKPLKGKVSKLTVPAKLREAYQIAQEKSLAIRCEKEIQRLRDNFKESERNNGIEFRAKLWLLENDISIDNFIFYKHTQKCTFGWRTALTKDQIESLKLKLNGFPFPKMLDFKVA